MTRIVRACLYGFAGAVVLGLVGCSDPLSNGYGGWYWQMPETSASSVPTAAANSGTSGATHAKASTTSAGGSQG
jgi:uncharacterized lipoprotein NlpE involved in copper resistance